MAIDDGNRVLELFGYPTRSDQLWDDVISTQWCPFTNTRCFKVRKSNPAISIGTCLVRYGKRNQNIVICPKRLLERRQVFIDAVHLLTKHDPGNELHVIPEMSIPGGSVDYFVASVRRGRVRDFIALEFQTLDTTGTLWPERQRLLQKFGLKTARKDVVSTKTFGMNWKMTAKTILVQLHHKVETLEHIGKHFLLVVQDHLLEYLRREFHFDHLNGVRIGDTMHIHSYGLDEVDGEFRMELNGRFSTDAAGVAKCLGLQAESKIELETIIAELEKKITPKTRLTIDAPIPKAGDMPAE